MPPAERTSEDGSGQVSPDPGAEIRRFRTGERRPIVLPAMLRDRSGAFAHRVHVVDLGLGGAGLELDGRIDPGHLIVLEVNAPNLWDPLVLRGRVVWFRPRVQEDKARVGIAFEAEETSLYPLLEVLTANVYE
jgi:hypothetical protein